MVFGDREAVKAALDARDSVTGNFLQNGDMVNEMAAVDTKAVWSLLDAKGTQTMMKSVLGEASQLADYDTVKEPHEELALYDGFLERRALQHGGGDVGHDYGRDRRDADEGRRDGTEKQRLAA